MSEKIDRRSFLEKTGLIVGGVSLATIGALGATSCQEEINLLPLNLPKDKIRLGVIGTGQRFIEQISIALKYLPNFELIACADVIPGHLKNGLQFASKGAKGYNDYRALLENKDVDAVVVCTPLVSHFQIASDAISAGKHVICEKTMTYSIEEAIELEKIVKRNPKLKFRVSHEYRKNPTINKVKEIVQSGVLGKVTQIYSKWDSYTDWRREVTDLDFSELINWRLKRKYCGGLMTEMITHLVDNVNYIFD